MKFLGSFKKINDMTNSPLREKYLKKTFVPATNNAVCFGRVSTKEQKDHGNSDAAQMETIAAYADRENLKIIKSWDVAETASKHAKRKNFLEMLEYVKINQSIKHIIFSHQSRSNRNRDSARALEDLVRFYGVTLHCARDGLKLTKASDVCELIKWDLFNNMNAKAIEDHTANVMDGTIKAIEEGRYPGRSPFGYRNFRREDGKSVHVVVEEKAAYIRMAFELFATGQYSLPALEKELKQKFPGLQKKPSWKRLWELLQDPFYYGDFRYAGQISLGSPEYQPPIIDFTLWKTVQDVFNKPNRSKRKVTQRDHPYIGLIKCGGRILDVNGNETDEFCGCSITGEEKRKKLLSGEVRRFFYWHCSNSTRRCSQRNKEYMEQRGLKVSYSEEKLEGLMAGMFAKLRFSEEVCQWMVSILKEQHRAKSGHDQKQRALLKGRHEMLCRHIDAAYTDKLNGVISEDMWRKRHDQWRLEKEQVEKELKFLGEVHDEYIENGALLIELAQKTKIIYENSLPEVKRKLVEIVSSNRILVDARIEYDYRKPFDILAKVDQREEWWR